MQPLKVTIVPVTPFAQNCSIVACTATNRAASSNDSTPDTCAALSSPIECPIRKSG